MADIGVQSVVVQRVTNNSCMKVKEKEDIGNVSIVD